MRRWFAARESPPAPQAGTATLNPKGAKASFGTGSPSRIWRGLILGDRTAPGRERNLDRRSAVFCVEETTKLLFPTGRLSRSMGESGQRNKMTCCGLPSSAPPQIAVRLL